MSLAHEPAANGEADQLELLLQEGREAATAERFEDALATFRRVLDLDATEAEALYGVAFCLRKLSRHEEAERALDDALERYPFDTRLLRERGLLRRAQGRYEDALTSFDAALDVDDSEQTTIVWKVGTLRLMRRFAEAEEVLDDALARLGETPELLNERAWLHDQRGQYAEGLAAFERALELHAENAAALEGRVTQLRRLRRFDDADRALSEAVDRIGETASLLVERGWLADDRGELEEALAAFERALDIAPRNEDALTWRATELRHLRRFEEAEHALDEARARVGETAALVNERGWLHYDRGEHEQALTQFERALELQPLNEDALAWRATELRQLGRPDEAERALADARAKLGESPMLLNEQGWLHHDRGERDQALAQFERALELDPRNQTAVTWRAVELRLLGRLDDAERAIADAVERIGETPALSNQKGHLADARRRYADAVAHFERTLELDPRNEIALSWRATELRQLRRFDEADAAIQDAIARVGETPSLVVERAWLHDDRGERVAALADFERAIELEPTNETALVWRAIELRQLRRFDDAEHAVAEASERVGDVPAVLNERGWLLLERDRYGEALETFKRAELADRSPSPLLGELEALQRARRTREARAVAERLQQTFAGDVSVREQVGWFFLRQNDLKRAKDEFRFLASVGEEAFAHNGMGGAYFNDGRYDLAEEEFRAVCALDPSRTYTMNLAWALLRQDEPRKIDEAYDLCQRVLAGDPENANAYGCLGVIAFKQGRFREAEENLQTTIELNPREGSYTDLGALYVQMGRYDEAETALTKALEVDPTDVRARIELGQLHLERDEMTDAVRELRHAAALDPRDEDAVRGYAVALWRAGAPGEAERVLRDGIRRLDARKRWLLHVILARVLVERGDDVHDAFFYREALKEVGEAKRLRRDSDLPFYESGVIHLRLDNLAAAWKEFNDCLERNPDNFEALRYRAQLKRALREKLVRSSMIGGALIALVSIGQLIALWVLYLTGRVSETVLATVLPILMGLFVVAFLLPVLTALRLPGVSAQFSRRGESVSAGPMGSVGYESTDSGAPTTGPAAISAGPR